ncbi:hypothetical protein CY34DRAFT_804034 [Suillus luteus UH-Slu-Lm8-n1]|uniref:DUF6534 domain-containing protein n=1 Tax=Suillus luteus UH-Slu-Lm8-n1 TaxID=930992 RepID=A0A0D0AN41_9AGAM|nr:hypothetical protein CY34DRAFT_804034 [Suillus luteus UH-Slu-Lm8-n1]
MSSIVGSIMQGPLCGSLVSMLLYGVICMQTFRYWQTYEHDMKILKRLVAFVWILETAHTVLTIYTIEFYLIMHFGDDAYLEFSVWSMPISYIIGFVIAYSVNLCFIWRVLQLSQKRWIAICLVIFATIRCGFGFGNCSIALMYPVWKIFREKVYQTMIVGWALSAVVDSSIAFMLYLYLRKRRTGTNRNDNILNQLLLYSINTGAVTSFCAVMVLILFLCIPSNLAFIGFVQIQSKFYAISLLASLNNREKLRMTEQANTTLEGIGNSLLPRLSAIKPSQHKLLYLQPMKFRTATVTDIDGDGRDTVMDGPSQESEC